MAILPSLVNAHTHLEFSDLPDRLGHPGISLADWIMLAIQARINRDDSKIQATMRSAVAASRNVGVGLIADIATPPNVLDGAIGPTEVIAFAEVLGLAASRFEERFETARSIDTGGISPHAPYSVQRRDIDRIIQQAIDSRQTVAMHLAESPDERELCFGQGGPFAQTLRGIGAWRDGMFPWHDDSDWCGVIESLSRAKNALLVHGNDFNENELRCIASHRNLTIVYCPRTHHFFGHRPHPIGEAWRRGIRVAIGTDSMASNPDLSIWKEVQFLLGHRPDLDPQSILASATLHGADSLGRGDKGRIEIGARPGLVHVATHADDVPSLIADFAESAPPRFID